VNPQWVDEEPGTNRLQVLSITSDAWYAQISELFSTACKIHCDTSEVAEKLPALKNIKDGRIHYTLDFDIVLSFGLTELKAQISWKDINVRLHHLIFFCFYPDINSGVRTKVLTASPPL